MIPSSNLRRGSGSPASNVHENAKLDGSNLNRGGGSSPSAVSARNVPDYELHRGSGNLGNDSAGGPGRPGHLGGDATFMGMYAGLPGVPVEAREVEDIFEGPQ